MFSFLNCASLSGRGSFFSTTAPCPYTLERLGKGHEEVRKTRNCKWRTKAQSDYTDSRKAWHKPWRKALSLAHVRLSALCLARLGNRHSPAERSHGHPFARKCSSADRRTLVCGAGAQRVEGFSSGTSVHLCETFESHRSRHQRSYDR